jgi:hypothetical protein
MKRGHDLKSDIQFRIWNNPHYLGNLVLIAFIHEAPDVRRAENIHCLQVSHVHEKTKSWFDFDQREPDFFGALTGLDGINRAAIDNRESIVGLVQIHREHATTKPQERAVSEPPF